MNQQPPPPSSNAGLLRPRAQPQAASDGKLPANTARPRTALGASRSTLLVSDSSSDDDSDGMIRRNSGTFVPPPPARGTTPSISRPAMRQLQLPNRDGAQRFVVSDDGSGDEIGNVSGSRPDSSFPPLFSPRCFHPRFRRRRRRVVE